MSSKTENEMNNTEQVTAGKKVSRKHLLSLAVIAVLLGVFLFWGLHDGASKGEDNPKNTTEAAIEKVTPPTFADRYRADVPSVPGADLADFLRRRRGR